MVEALAGAGACVLVVDIDEEPIDDVCRSTIGRVVGHRADISDEGEVALVVEHAQSEFGHIDAIVNNAGIGLSAIRTGDRYANPIRFWELDRHWWDRFFAVHVLGPFHLAKLALGDLRTRPHGRIVTVTTSLSTMLAGTNAPYGPVKAASEALCSAMAHDLDGSTVTANVLVPGGAADTRYVPDVPSRPRASLVPPSVMRAPIVFLCSPDSDGLSAKRVTARQWDPFAPDAQNLERCVAPIGWEGV